MGELKGHFRHRTRKYWKERADESRAIADDFTDPYIQEQMKEIADWYDKMAERTPPSPEDLN